MADTNETIADIIAGIRRRSDEAYKGSFNYPECQENQIEYDEASDWADRLEEAHKREITILLDALAEVVASIEVRFPAIEYAIDRKPYLDAKKILEQYKEEAALATTSSQTTQED